MVNGILDSVAEFEGAQIRARIKLALDQKRKRGEKLGGRVPYGYDAVAGRLVPRSDEQATIALIRDLAGAGMSQRAIVRELASRGVVSRAGKPFAQMQVWRILAA